MHPREPADAAVGGHLPMAVLLTWLLMVFVPHVEEWPYSPAWAPLVETAVAATIGFLLLRNLWALVRSDPRGATKGSAWSVLAVALMFALLSSLPLSAGRVEVRYLVSAVVAGVLGALAARDFAAVRRRRLAASAG